jgi:peptidyl-dipeptidase Dcp
MKHYMLTACFLAIVSISCQQPETKKATDMDNPFFSEYNTPYQVPPFHLIKDHHFRPALMEGIAAQRAEIQAIVDNPEAPNFANTIEAMEFSGALLGKVSRVFYNLSSANTNDSLKQISKDMAPVLSAHRDDIWLNPQLFERVKAVYDQRESLGLHAEQLKVLENTYKNFVRSGANLSMEQKERLREINKQLSGLTVQYGQNVLAETNAFQLWIENEEDLAGLPEGLKQAAANDAKAAGQEGKWLFTLQNPSVMPFLQFADNRELRKQIWEAYMMRGDQGNDRDNNEIITQMVALRAEKANLLGYQTHAHYVLEESMAKTPENVYTLLDQLWKPALKVANKELDEIRAMIRAEGKDFKPEPWDWRYYAEKIKAQKYQLEEEALKPYFSLDQVRDGIFYTVGNLFGLTFELLKDMPVYHPEVSVYQVKRNGEHLGILYMDFHPRESKRGGAWMTSYRTQRMDGSKRIDPVISIVCNFSKPTGDTPALLTFDEVETYFHEFGHAIHGLLSQVQYESLAGTAVPRDFVELPSQVLENWAPERDVLKQYAKHYQTGEVIPDALLEKMKKSALFNQGFATVEYLAASYLDMSYHTLQGPMAGKPAAFEKEAMAQIGLMDEIIPRYRSTYFSHIFSGGYSSGYYSYIWSAVLDTDAFEAFKENGLFDTKTADAFRTYILERGGTGDPAEMYRQFRGADPSVKPLLAKRGLN